MSARAISRTFALMAGPVCDTSEFPFVFVHFPPENATDAEVRALIDEQRRILQRKQRFVMLIDSSRPTSSSSVQRRMYADWMREAEVPSRLYCAGMAVVLASPILRGAMQAVLWVFTPPMPVETFADIDDAARRCADWMRTESLANADAPLRVAKRRVA